MQQCTWKGKDIDRCTEVGTHQQINRDEVVWANLCDEHHNKLESAIKDKNIKLMVGYWVAASGGPQKLSQS